MAIEIKGKMYVMVNERVQAAHADEGFSMVSEETFELNGRYFLRITIEVKGKRYIGTSEIKFDAPKNTPDGQSPMECAQTSSLGRALGAAGYGVFDGIASADEIVRSQPATNNTPSDLKTRLQAVTARAKALGVAKDNNEWQAMLRYLEIEKVRGVAELSLIDAYLDQQQQEKAG